MINAMYGVGEEEVFRLLCGYVSIRNPAIRREFLHSIELWAREQWHAVDEN